MGGFQRIAIAAVAMAAVGASVSSCTGSAAAQPPVRVSGPFQTAHGAVVCDINRANVGCEMHASRQWRVPPMPKDCHYDWMGGVDLGQSGAAAFGCWSGEPGLGAKSIPTFVAGRVVVNGPMRCVVENDGVRCEDTSTHHGFVYQRARYRLY